MELILEIVMCVLLDIAVLLLLCTVVRAGNDGKKNCRFVSGMLALGFLFGISAQTISGGNIAVVLLLALGFALSSITFVFTFPERRKRNDNR